MLVHDFAIVALPNEAVADLLTRRGDRLVRRAVERAGIDAPLDIQLGQLLSGPQSSLMPICLRIGGAAPFRSFDGDLEFFELDDGVTQLRVQGSYGPTPPLQSSRIEHARVEAAVRLLLQELGRSLEHTGGATRVSG